MSGVFNFLMFGVSVHSSTKLDVTQAKKLNREISGSHLRLSGDACACGLRHLAVKTYVQADIHSQLAGFSSNDISDIRKAAGLLAKHANSRAARTPNPEHGRPSLFLPSDISLRQRKLRCESQQSAFLGFGRTGLILVKSLDSIQPTYSLQHTARSGHQHTTTVCQWLDAGFRRAFCT